MGTTTTEHPFRPETAKAGDIVIIERSDSGMMWPAMVDCITKGGRVHCWWLRHDNSGGPRGTRTRARAVGTRERIVRRAAPFEAAAFRKHAGIE